MNQIKIIILLLLSGLLANAQQPLSLTDAISKALENNYGIIIAKGNQQIAEIQNNWGTAGRYPYINFSASDNNTYNILEGDERLERVTRALLRVYPAMTEHTYEGQGRISGQEYFRELPDVEDKGGNYGNNSKKT